MVANSGSVLQSHKCRYRLLVLLIFDSLPIPLCNLHMPVVYSPNHRKLFKPRILMDALIVTGNRQLLVKEGILIISSSLVCVLLYFSSLNFSRKF